MITLNTPLEIRMYAEFLMQLADFRGAKGRCSTDIEAATDTAPQHTNTPTAFAQAPTTQSTAPVHQPIPASGLDSTGLPWDERIHSSSKTINADGTWRLRKGISKDLVAEVTAQLKGLPVTSVPPVALTQHAAMQQAAQQVEQHHHIAPPQQVEQHHHIAPPQQPVMQAAAAPLLPPVSQQVPVQGHPQQGAYQQNVPSLPPAAQQLAAVAVDWPLVCQAMQEALARGVAFDRINGVAQQFGLTAFALGASRPDLHAQLYNSLIGMTAQ